jgi:hypothetical protein
MLIEVERVPIILTNRYRLKHPLSCIIFVFNVSVVIILSLLALSVWIIINVAKFCGDKAIWITGEFTVLLVVVALTKKVFTTTKKRCYRMLWYNCGHVN